MEGEISQRSEFRAKALPHQVVITTIALGIVCFSGAAGFIAAQVMQSGEIPFYIQCGTTFVVLLISIFETATLVTWVRWMKWKMNIDKRKTSVFVNAYQFQEAMLQNGPNISYRDFTTCDILGLCIGFLGVNTGIMLVLWCITVAQMYPTHAHLKGYLWPFIITDVIVGVIAPMLMIFSIIPIVKIIRYVSHNRLETRKLLLWFLPFLGYERGSKGVYWVLQDSFYYNIHSGCCGSLSTALLYANAALTFLFSWLYFIDDVFIRQIGLNSCMQLSPIEKETAYCFHIRPTDLNVYVNCSESWDYSDNLFCFEFKETGRNINLIQSLVISIVLYYISVICISLTFQIMKFLQQFAQSYLWPTLLVATGFVSFLLGLIHFTSALYFNYYLNVLTLFQVLIISANICVVGILVAGGQLMQDHQSFSENTSVLWNSYQDHNFNSAIHRDVTPGSSEIAQPPDSTTQQQESGSTSNNNNNGVELVAVTRESPEIGSLPPSPTNSPSHSPVSPPSPSSTPPPGPSVSSTILDAPSNAVSSVQPSPVDNGTVSNEETAREENGVVVVQQVSESQTTLAVVDTPKKKLNKPNYKRIYAPVPQGYGYPHMLPHMIMPRGRLQYHPTSPNYFVISPPPQTNAHHPAVMPLRVAYTNIAPTSFIATGGGRPTWFVPPTPPNNSTPIQRNGTDEAAKRTTIV